MFVYKKAVLNLNFICNFNNFRVMNKRGGGSITLFKIDNSKCLFLANVETVNCTEVLSPYDAGIVNV